MKDNIVYLSIGSNIGERIHYLKFAITALLKDVNISRLRMSSIYETVPIGYTKQDEFLNMVVEIYTTYKPVELLYVTKEIQNLAGRKKSIRWGPRTLDLDILLYNQENVEMEHLQIPHPRMFERGFVIIPLKEINPKLYFSNIGKSIEDIYLQLTDKEGVRIWKEPFGEEEFALSENLKVLHKNN